MAEYRKKDTGEIHTETEIKENNKNMSFPLGSGINADLIDHLGYELIYPSGSPTPSSNTKIIVQDGVEKIDGKWFTKWSEIDRHKTYTDEDGKTVTKASQDATWQDRLDRDMMDSLRGQREPLLAEADWQIHKIEDADGDSSAWRTYRQQLRDITKASDIYNVTWPTKPS